ncbi:MAG: tRNA glutamyl-Q(34) synthetase GluQRS [Wenzhouxiangella sp.]
MIDAGTRPVLGRFAPSPTGDLHFGSLVAAAGSWLDARSQKGQWIIRIEDIDPPREVAGAAERQVAILRRFGLLSDQPVIRQSRLRPQHDIALASLLQAGLAYFCGCTRKQLPASGVYPGTCRQGIPAGRRPRSIRFRLPARDVEFHDGIQGWQCQKPTIDSGDFVIRRADGLIAYQLAVVVDDAIAGVTQVVRGSDLLDSTGRQILLHEALGWTPPEYSHLPLIVDENGRKLSKSEADDPVARYRPQEALRLALRALGHEPPRHCQAVDAQWRWALAHWQRQRVPAGPVAIGMQAAAR